MAVVTTVHEVPAGRAICRRLFVFFLIAISCAVTASAEAPDPIRTALSARHLPYPRSELERIAGGKDAFIIRLLQLRLETRPPYMPLRAEKMLLAYGDRDDVLSALEEDLRDSERRGLAQLIALHIDQLPLETSRIRIGREIIERSRRDESYLPFAKMLSESKDPVLRHMYEAR